MAQGDPLPMKLKSLLLKDSKFQLGTDQNIQSAITKNASSDSLSIK
jgi:hypothetical protein